MARVFFVFIGQWRSRTGWPGPQPSPMWSGCFWSQKTSHRIPHQPLPKSVDCHAPLPWFMCILQMGVQMTNVYPFGLSREQLPKPLATLLVENGLSFATHYASKQFFKVIISTKKRETSQMFVRFYLPHLVCNNHISLLGPRNKTKNLHWIINYNSNPFLTSCPSQGHCQREAGGLPGRFSPAKVLQVAFEALFSI